MGRSLGGVATLVLALLVAVLVWLVAVSESNPFEARALPAAVPVTLVGLPDGLIVVGTEPALAETAVTLRAPRSAWDRLGAGQVRVTADLSGLAAATYRVPLQGQVVDQPAARVVQLEPAAILVTIERRAQRDKAVRIEQTGEPAPGYEAGSQLVEVSTASVVGPASAVDRVSELVAAVSLANLKSSFDQTVVLIPLDSIGKPVSGVAVSPAAVRVRVPVAQRVGSRDVAVRAIIRGQIAPGYRITNITVAPPILTVSSADPAVVSDLPGFVETAPLDISGASDDVTQRLSLTLPAGVAPAGDDPTVVVQVSIAAIEGSTQVQRTLEVINLGSGLAARTSPESVDVLLSGPIPILDALRDGDVRVFLDLTGLGVGTFPITPTVVLLPDKLRAVTVRPSPVEVVIVGGAAVTPTRTPRPTRLPVMTRTSTPTPPTGTPTP